jgi:hypothetical protein
MTIAGLKLIVPTSVAGSGVSVSASGKVTFTAATAVNVNGCFSATYDNYLCVTNVVGSTNNQNLWFRLRASGTDASGSNYTRQYLAATSTSVFGARSTSQTTGFNGWLDGGRNGSHLYLYGPYLAQPTASRAVTSASEAGGSASIADDACTHSLSTSYDGITLLPSSGTLTGTLTIYGLSQ